MKDVGDALDRQIEQLGHAKPSDNELDRAGERWAIYSLRTFRGDTLTKALAVSQAIAEFTAELSETLTLK